MALTLTISQCQMVQNGSIQLLSISSCPCRCPLQVRWSSCPKCQQRMREEGLADERELQSYFLGRINRYLKTLGRRIIGWDEILEGGLVDGATVMSWRGEAGEWGTRRHTAAVWLQPDITYQFVNIWPWQKCKLPLYFCGLFIMHVVRPRSHAATLAL